MPPPRAPPPSQSVRRNRCRSRRESRMSDGIRHCVNSPRAARVRTREVACSESGDSCVMDELAMIRVHVVSHTALACAQGSRADRVARHDSTGRAGGRTLAAACSAVRAAAAAAALGELGGEKVGDGDEGVGGNAVSFHTRRSISCSPSAAARVSRSSSAAECSPLPSSSRWRSRAWRLGE